MSGLINNYRAWSDREIDRLRELCDAEVPVGVIAVEFERTKGSVEHAIRRYILEASIVWNDANVERLRRMYVDEAATPSQIALTMGTSTESIRDALAMFEISRIDLSAGNVRKCITCTRAFWSEWVGNRICNCCKRGEMYACA